jgi:hypothetical protein
VHSQLYKRDRYTYGARVWHIYNPPPVDGVLVSVSTVKGGKLKRMVERGAKEFLRMPRSMPLYGDCGAWQYRYLDEPPYKVEEVLELYEKLGVDYGVTVDHIALFGDPRRRMEVTYRNAVEALELWRRRGYGYELLAAVQGVEVEDYVAMFKDLYTRGFRAFAIGGLAKRSTDFVEKLTSRLLELVRELRNVQLLHFLGVTRARLVPLLKELEDYVATVSFDNATFLRMAWSRTVGNYVLPDGRVYTAIRVQEGGEHLLELLRGYDEGSVDLGRVVEVLKEYTSRTGDSEYLPYYVATLRDRPWRECGCAICRSIGVNVLIFRGNDRNRRRGFHNVYVFSTLLRGGDFNNVGFRLVRLSYPASGDLLAENLAREVSRARRVLVITHCTAEKSVDTATLRRLGLPVPSFDLEREPYYREVLKDFVKPASEMYRGTFKAVRKLVERIRECGRHADLYIVSARYGLVGEADAVVPYEATLKGMTMQRIREWAGKRSLLQKLNNLAKSGGYDLIIAILPKEYAVAVLDFLRNPPVKTIAVVPRGIAKALGDRALTLPGGSLPRRLKYIRELIKAFERSCTVGLERWVRVRFGNQQNRLNAGGTLET